MKNALPTALLLALAAAAPIAHADQLSRDEAKAVAAEMTDGQTLLVRGSEGGDERTLRFDVEAGNASAFTVETTTSIDQTVQGFTQNIILPKSVMTFRSSVTDTQDDGAHTTRVELTAVDIQETPGGMPGMSGVMRQQLGALIGSTITRSISATGEPGEPTTKTPAGVPQEVAGSFETTPTGGFVFPLEPVGVGSVWRTLKASTTPQGIETTVLSTYTLTEVTGTSITVDMHAHQFAEPQDIDPPQPGVTAKLVEFAGTIEGTITLDLTRNNPPAFDISSSAEIDFSINMNGDDIASQQTVEANYKTAD